MAGVSFTCTPKPLAADPNDYYLNKMSVCKTVMPPYCHIDTGNGTVHLLISKELIGKYRHHLRKEQGLKPNQFHKSCCMLLKDWNDNLIINSYRSMLQVLT